MKFNEEATVCHRCGAVRPRGFAVLVPAGHSLSLGGETNLAYACVAPDGVTIRCIAKPAYGQIPSGYRARTQFDKQWDDYFRLHNNPPPAPPPQHDHLEWLMRYSCFEFFPGASVFEMQAFSAALLGYLHGRLLPDGMAAVRTYLEAWLNGEQI